MYVGVKVRGEKGVGNVHSGGPAGRVEGRPCFGCGWGPGEGGEVHIVLEALVVVLGQAILEEFERT